MENFFVKLNHEAVVTNKSDQKLSYYLWVEGRAVEVNSLPHSIQTLVF
jgi:glucosylceramidase